MAQAAGFLNHTFPSVAIQVQSWSLGQGLQCNANATNIWLLPFPPIVYFSMTRYSSYQDSPGFVFLRRPLIPSVLYLPSLEGVLEALYKRLKGTCALSQPLISNKIINNNNNTKTGLGGLNPHLQKCFGSVSIVYGSLSMNDHAGLPWICQCQESFLKSTLLLNSLVMQHTPASLANSFAVFVGFSTKN